MQSGFRIGRVLGINIRIDWSWLFIFFLITWNLSSVFSQQHPNWDPTLQWGVAVVAALLFFISLLAHELAHSLMARAHGISVRSITMFLFGGVSNIQRDPDSPRDEFLIAVVGPITSFIIGVALLLIGSLRVGPLPTSVMANPTEVIGQLSPLPTMLLWLGSINVILGLFNLIPGFPLDGGRVLRSILWVLSGNLRRATLWASRIGQTIAGAMIFSGIAMLFGARLPFFGTGFANGLWLIFIGWFLNSAAALGYEQTVVSDMLRYVPVKNMMRQHPPTVSPDITITELVHENVFGTDDHAFPVLEHDRLEGLVTLEDIRAVAREAWDVTVVREIMTPTERLIAVSVDDDAAMALVRLKKYDVRQLPVLREGRLAGLLRRRDIVKWLQIQTELV